MREKEKRYGVYGVKKDGERTRIGVFRDLEYVVKVCEWELPKYEMMVVEDETI